MTESGKLPGGGDVGSGLCRGRIWIGRYAGDVGWGDSEAAATPSYDSQGPVNYYGIGMSGENEKAKAARELVSAAKSSSEATVSWGSR